MSAPNSPVASETAVDEQSGLKQLALEPHGNGPAETDTMGTGQPGTAGVSPETGLGEQATEAAVETAAEGEIVNPAATAAGDAEFVEEDGATQVLSQPQPADPTSGTGGLLVESKMRFDGCRRGQIWLSSTEAQNVNEFLATEAAKGKGSSRFRFVPLPDLRRKAGISATQQQQPAQPPIAGGPRSSVTSGVAARKTRQAQRQDKLAEWVRNFSRLMSALMQQEAAAPFVDGLPYASSTPISSGAPGTARRAGEPHLTRGSQVAVHKREILQNIQPYLELTSLRAIQQKLDANQYATPLTAFNEVYNFLLTGYRHYPPASERWMQLHETTTAFFVLSAASPLKDTFDGRPSVITATEHKRPSVSAAHHPPRPPRKKKKPRHPPADRVKTPLPPTGERPIRSRDRRQFERLVESLPPELHVALFETFRDTAKWREIDEGAGVELDESTPYSIFKEMINWCLARVSSRKRSAAKQAGLAAKRRRQEEAREAAIASAGAAEGAAPTVEVMNPYQVSSEDEEISSSSSESESASESDSGAESDGGPEESSDEQLSPALPVPSTAESPPSSDLAGSGEPPPPPTTALVTG